MKWDLKMFYMEKTLVYHLYVNSDDINQKTSYNVHKKCLEQFKHIFDKVLFVITVNDLSNNIAIKNDLDIVKSDFYFYFGETNKVSHSGMVRKKITNKILNIEKETSFLKLWHSIWSAIYKREFLLENNINQYCTYILNISIIAKILSITMDVLFYY